MSGTRSETTECSSEYKEIRKENMALIAGSEKLKRLTPEELTAEVDLRESNVKTVGINSQEFMVEATRKLQQRGQRRHQL